MIRYPDDSASQLRFYLSKAVNSFFQSFQLIGYRYTINFGFHKRPQESVSLTPGIQAGGREKNWEAVFVKWGTNSYGFSGYEVVF